MVSLRPARARASSAISAAEPLKNAANCSIAGIADSSVDCRIPSSAVNQWLTSSRAIVSLGVEVEVHGSFRGGSLRKDVVHGGGGVPIDREGACSCLEDLCLRLVCSLLSGSLVRFGRNDHVVSVVWVSQWGFLTCSLCGLCCGQPLHDDAIPGAREPWRWLVAALLTLL